MRVVRYAVCSELAQKPVTRGVFDERAEAERALERLRRKDAEPETTYWIAELGPECESWRFLGTELPPTAGG